MRREGWNPLVTLALVGALPYALWMAVALIETATLTDMTPGNHITAAFRWALDRNPHLTVILLVCWVVSWIFPAGVILGHIYHDWSGKRRD